jgi:hypothetical protein
MEISKVVEYRDERLLEIFREIDLSKEDRLIELIAQQQELRVLDSESEERLYEIESSIDEIDNEIMYRIVTDTSLSNEAQRKAAKKKIEASHNLLKTLRQEQSDLSIKRKYLDLLIKQAGKLQDFIIK